MSVLATILVVLADSIFAISMLTNRKSILTILLVVSDALFAGQYLCYDNGLTGALSILVDICFLITVYLLETKHKEKYIWLASCIAIIMTIVIGILSWSGAISILPILAICIYLLGMIINKIYFVKVACFARNVLNVIYMFLLSQYVGAVLEICLAISALIGTIISLKQEKIKTH